MKNFIHFLTGIVTTIVLLATLLLTTLNFQIKDSKFFIDIFRSRGVYAGIQKSAHLGFREFTFDQIRLGQGIDPNNLNKEEQDRINTVLTDVEDKITQKRLQRFIEENVIKVFDYIHDKSDKLVLYTPFSEWDIVQDVPKEIVVQDYLTQRGDLELLATLSSFHGIGTKIQGTWILSMMLTIFCLFLYTNTVTKNERLKSLAQLFLTEGTIILLISLLIRAGISSLTVDLSKETASIILAQTLVPPFVVEITKLWLAAGAFLVLGSIGITAYISSQKTQRPLA